MTPNEYQTSDLGAAAFVQVKGYRLLRLLPLDGRRMVFVFDDPGNTAEQTALEFFSGASAPARALIEAHKGLKALVYQSKEQHEHEHRPYVRTR